MDLKNKLRLLAGERIALLVLALIVVIWILVLVFNKLKEPAPIYLKSSDQININAVDTIWIEEGTVKEPQPTKEPKIKQKAQPKVAPKPKPKKRNHVNEPVPTVE